MSHFIDRDTVNYGPETYLLLREHQDWVVT